ncbi:hypothetical protein B0A50_04093 [Salinomyces thailandicus]|uniref:Uncharacterized protein n=1 Tax=Salinomyces thailandicus TaxID=706561 RepID=A0A4U0U0Y5_9PEZI|nr:hypothetical protein B0A50_04093 [Salinomyces thailandica]
MSQQASSQPEGPPYFPTGTSIVGGHPNLHVDVPILAVLLTCYLGGAIANMTILQLNRKRNHWFPMTGALFGFCMSRIATCALRISWAADPLNTNLAIATTIFQAIGVLIVFVILVVIAQRMLRATHPELGWSKGLNGCLEASFVGLFIAIVLTVAFTVYNFFTLDAYLKTVALWVQRAGLLYFLLFTLIAPILILLSVILPTPKDHRAPETFGTGSLTTKYVVHGVAMFFAIFIVGFRMGTIWADPRPETDPAWWDAKAAFYVIEFAFEIIIVYWLIWMRFDQKFWVPNKSKGPGDYSRIGSFYSPHDRLVKGEA